MKKLLLIPLFLVACSKKENYAEIMVHAQVPDADCAGEIVKRVAVADCTLPTGEEIMAFYGKGYPFQVYQLKKLEPKKEAPPVDAGVSDAGVIDAK